MKIKKWVTIDEEIEVDISIDDIRVVLEESDSPRILPRNLDAILSYLKGITDKLIAEMQCGTRKSVIDILKQTIERCER